jgi:hypothetical protein
MARPILNAAPQVENPPSLQIKIGPRSQNLTNLYIYVQEFFCKYTVFLNQRQFFSSEALDRNVTNTNPKFTVTAMRIFIFVLNLETHLFSLLHNIRILGY